MSETSFNIPTPLELKTSREAKTTCACAAFVANKSTWDPILHAIAYRIAKCDYKAWTLADGTVLGMRFEVGPCSYQSLNNNEAREYISSVFAKYGWNQVRVWHEKGPQPTYYLHVSSNVVDSE